MQNVLLEELRCPMCRLNSVDVTSVSMADGAPALPENTPPTAHDIKAATRGAVTDVDAQNPFTPPTTSVGVLSPVGSPSVVAAEPRDSAF